MNAWLLGHFVGDYLLQTDDMAIGKKVSSWWCSYHVATYMVAMAAFCDLPWWALLLIAAQHWVQDRTGFVVWLMNMKGSDKFAKPPMAPWSIIVTDNILHILWIAWVVSLV